MSEEYTATKAHVGAVVAGFMSALTAIMAGYMGNEEALSLTTAFGTVVTVAVTWGVVYWTRNKPKENTEDA